MKVKRFNQEKELLETLIGKTLNEARELASFNGYEIRTIREDNERFFVTMDLRFDRINLEIDNKKVTKASVG